MTDWRQVGRRFAAVAHALALNSRFANASTEEGVVSAATACFATPSRDAAYLLLSVLKLELPFPHEVTATLREWRGSGSASWITALARHSVDANATTPECEIRAGVVVDVTDTAASEYVTGIQRVVRELIADWSTRAHVTTVTWDLERRRLNEVSLDSVWRAGRAIPLIVPFNGVFVLPEIAVEGPRAARITTIAQHSRRSIAVGHDCIPLTTAETSSAGMPGAFAKYLAALASFSEVVTTSVASEAEFTGWIAMLGEGAPAPAITRVSLPRTGSSLATLGAPGATSDRPAGGRPPLVLVVGSHEPRKNHLRILDASERLWRAGNAFELVMVGGNSWDAEEFTQTVTSLREAGHPVSIVTSASDAELWSLYRRAAFSVFVSLNEGYGLPIVESISHGTPVITSSFGSMAELGTGNGALLVDPKNSQAIVMAMQSVLTDSRVREDLIAAASSADTRTWSEYAGELWSRVALE